MSAPHPGDAIFKRQRRVRVARDIRHRKIVVDERVSEAREGDRDKDKLPLGRGTRDVHPRVAAARRSGERDHALHHCDDERERQRELAQFRCDHFFCSCGITSVCDAFCDAACAFFTASPASGGM